MTPQNGAYGTLTTLPLANVSSQSALVSGCPDCRRKPVSQLTPAELRATCIRDVGWLDGSLVRWLVGWLTGWLTG